MVGPLEKSQVADQQRHLEEADAYLVDRAASVVGTGVRNEVLFWPQLKREPQSILRFCSRTFQLAKGGLETSALSVVGEIGGGMHVRTMHSSE